MKSVRPVRRRLLGMGAGVGAAMVAGWSTVAAAAQAMVRMPVEVTLDPIPPLPAVPSPGKPGDFAFLTGEWRIKHFRPKAEQTGWDTFDGEATVHGILNGIGSVEELRIPARNFSGMGLRLLDVENRRWTDFWVNARSGVLTTPGQTGSFEQGNGIFVSQDLDDGVPVTAVGIWDRITARTCRWRQATSRDGGRTWDQNWIMEWTRRRR